MGRCETCKWWEEAWEGQGKCPRLYMRITGFYEVDERRQLSPRWVPIVPKDFGCVEHEPRAEGD